MGEVEDIQQQIEELTNRIAALQASGGISALSPTNFDEGAPGNVPVPQLIKNEALKTHVAGTVPPSVDLGSGVGPLSGEMTKQIAAARHKTGLSRDFTRARPESSFISGLKDLGNEIPVVKHFVPNSEAATFKNVTIEEILADPALSERWKKLSPQEQAFALLDGSNKAVDVLSLSQEKYDRLMGSTASSDIKGVRTTVRQPGLIEQRQARAGSGGVRSQPGGATVTQEDFNTPIQGTVLKDGVFPGKNAGDTIMVPPRRMAEFVNEGWARPQVDEPDESKTYINKAGDVRTWTNREFASDPKRREEYIESKGTMATVIDRASGDTVSRPIETVALNPSAYKAADARGLISVVDKDGTPGFMREEDINRSAFGDASKRADQAEVRTGKLAESAVKVPQMMMQSMSLLEVMRKAGPRTFGIAGGIAVTLDQIAKYFNQDEAGQAIFNAITGGSELTGLQVRQAESELIAIATSRKETLLNDRGRLSDKDIEILIGMNASNDAFADGEQIALAIQKFAGFEIVYDEMIRDFNGDKPLFPVGTVDEYIATKRKIAGYKFDEDMVTWIVQNLHKAHETAGGKGNR